MVIKTIWSFCLEGIVSSKKNSDPDSCCSESLTYVCSVPGDQVSRAVRICVKKSSGPFTVSRICGHAGL